MVQIKQKSNKINVMALITCFVLVVVFVFEGVSFTWAYPSVPVSKSVSDRFDNWELENSIDKCLYVSAYVGSNTSSEYIAFLDVDITKYNVVGFKKNNDYSEYVTYFFYLADDGKYHKLGDICNYKMTYDIHSNLKSSWDGSTFGFPLNSNSYCNVPIYFSDIAPQFLTLDDVNSYMFSDNKIMADKYNYVKTEPKEEIEYDSDIEVPINLDIQLNGSSDFVPNVRISCNQSESIDNRQLEVSYSVGYRATWHLMGGIGLHIKSKTSPVVYSSIEQLNDSFDNSGTAFETIISLSKFSNSSPPDKNAFTQYEPAPKVYWSLKEIKNENSEIKVWVRNRVGNKASKWVMVSGDSYKANFDVVSSDENGKPTDLKDNSANADTGYGSDYWNNRDITPQEDYSSTNVKTNLKDLKSNYTSLANFYKELFSFLPAEIWIILIGLVSTMVVIAILKFVRG